MVADRSLVAGVDGCPGGWVAFRENLDSGATAVEVVDPPAILRDRPHSLAPPRSTESDSNIERILNAIRVYSDALSAISIFVMS